MKTSRNWTTRPSLGNPSRTAEDHSLSSKNAIAIVVIVLVLAGGAMALYRLDTGQGTRTSPSIAAKTASD